MPIFLLLHIITVHYILNFCLGNTLSSGFGSLVTLRFRVSPTTVGCSEISWTYEGSTVLNSLSSLNGASLSFSSDCYSLTISNVNCNSGGRYQLSATNSAGSDSDYIDLYLAGKSVCICTQNYCSDVNFITIISA